MLEGARKGRSPGLGFLFRADSLILTVSASFEEGQRLEGGLRPKEGWEARRVFFTVA